MKLYSYVVEHDTGFAPNPYFDICSLAHCKYGKKKRNIIELAKKGDWVVGTGGKSKRSSGHGTIIYAMRVDEILTLKKYYHNSRFTEKKVGNISFESSRGDNLSKFKNDTNRLVLLSFHYFYFGENAIPIPSKFKNHKTNSLEKIGPSYKSCFDDIFICDFTSWLQSKYSPGIYGNPCTYEVEKQLYTDEIKNKKGSC